MDGLAQGVVQSIRLPGLGAHKTCMMMHSVLAVCSDTEGTPLTVPTRVCTAACPSPVAGPISHDSFRTAGPKPKVKVKGRISMLAWDYTIRR